jgi:hypothetical protein
MGRAFLLAAPLVAALELLAASPARAQASEAEIKAAFLPRFARYVTWPPAATPRAGDPYILCVIGGNPFGAAVDQAARSQSVDGRRIIVRRLDSAAGSDGCQIAFVQGTRAVPAGQLLAALGRKPVLTVTDAANGGQRGIIHFVTASGRVRFFIDESEAARRGLTISSRLLALAVGVKQR